MSKLDDIKSKLRDLRDSVANSEAFQELAEKWDELDSRVKFKIQLGAMGGVVFLVLFSVFASISNVNGLKRSLEEKDALIGYLQNSADEIKQLRSQSTNNLTANAASSPLNSIAETVLPMANIDASRAVISPEREGSEDKNTKEVLVDVKFTQVNIRQIVKFMYNIAETGKAKSVYIRDLNIDTKEDPAGYIDAALTVAGFIPKSN